MWPTGEPRPTTANLNFVAAQTVPNLVIVKVGTGGKVSLFNYAGSAHLIADVTGWYADGSQFVPITPQRLLDTRSGQGGVTGPTSGSRDVTVLGQAGIPTSGVTAVILTVTVTQPTADLYLTVWPKGFDRPTAANVNAYRNQTKPNLVVAKVGNEGKISYYTNSGTTHVVMDVFGYVSSATSLTQLFDEVDDNTIDWYETTVQSQGYSVPDSVTIKEYYGVCSTSSSYWTEYNLGRQWKSLATKSPPQDC